MPVSMLVSLRDTLVRYKDNLAVLLESVEEKIIIESHFFFINGGSAAQVSNGV